MEHPPTPAQALRKFMESKELTAYELSKRTILATSRISEILSGKRRITTETSTILGAFFNTGTEYWVEIQTTYDILRSGSHDAIPWEARGDLSIGGIRVRCYVTADERRLISEADFHTLFGFKGPADAMRRRAEDLLNSPYLGSQSIRELRKKILSPIRIVGSDHLLTYAYEGEIVVDYCRALMDVRRVKGLPQWAEGYAEQSEIIVMSVAKVGITALIDEATGHQSRRHRDALQRLLARYFREEYAAWTKRFPDWFYEELFRLKGWTWDAMSSKRPSVVGRITKDIVYSRLEQGVIDELELKNPVNDNGRRRQKHHQWLSDEVGHPALDTHFYALKGLMRAHHDYKRFYHTLQMAFPKKNESVQLELEDYRNDENDDS